MKLNTLKCLDLTFKATLRETPTAPLLIWFRAMTQKIVANRPNKLPIRSRRNASHLKKTK